ncbi:MAG TPA: hypothetical protein PLI34_08365 [Saprospiraceae bacterium]|nr:hypothetical protein [Saprospiraceae bacterium]HRK83804.1 hypothetical protein [Saprospiraceae bacterium]
MENLIFEQKNNHAGRGRGLQLVALGDMLNSYKYFLSTTTLVLK